MALAWLLLCVGAAAFALQGNSDPLIAGTCRIILPAASGLSVVMFIIGFMGLFQRYFDRYSPLARYIAESSYWVFIVHSVFQVAIAVSMAKLLWPAGIKFTVVLAGSTLLSVLSYDLWVRNGRLGELLNGRRYPRGLAKK